MKLGVEFQSGIIIEKPETDAEVIDAIQKLLLMAATDQVITNLAHSIADGTPEPIDAIHDWMQNTFYYTEDPPDVNLFVSPSIMIESYLHGSHVGHECAVFAMTTATMLREIGVQARVVLIDQTGKGLDHAFCEAYSDVLGWIPVDTSTKIIPLGWREPYFNKVIVDG